MTKIYFVLVIVACVCGFGQSGRWFIPNDLRIVADVDVKVSIYYESKCPDSIRFIVQQFWPAYKKIGSAIKIDLVPYGKASVYFDEDTGKYVWQCQHGPQECYGNAYHACAIALYSPEASAEFVYCSLSAQDPTSDETLRECAQSSGLTWANLQQCYNSGQSDKLLIANGNRTDNVTPKITFIPTILINDNFDVERQTEIREFFLHFICEYLNQQPDACKDNIQVVLIPN